MPIDYSQYLSDQTPQEAVYNDNPYSGAQIDWTQESPGQANREDRAYFGNLGQNTGLNLTNQQQFNNQLQNKYRNAANSAYNDLGANPGYADQEIADQSRYPQYQSGMATQQQYQGLYMTPQESQNIQGDPSSYNDYFDPSLMRSENATAADLQRGNFNDAKVQQAQSAGTLAGTLNSVNSNPNLQQSVDYRNYVGNTLGTGANSINGALNKSDLTLDPSLKNTAEMSDQELQGLQDHAARTVQLTRQSALEDIGRRAAASGNSDPMALAALRQEYQRSADADAADASTNAYLSGRQQQANQAMNYEQARTGAQGNYSNLATSNANQIANRGLAAANDAENMRLGATQDIANRQGSAANALANQQMNTAQWTGNTGIGMEQGLGNQAASTEQYIGTTGAGINQNMDQAASDRAAQIYNNRSNLGQFGINTNYSQNTGVQDRQAQAAQNAANARIGGQTDYRNFLTGQTNNAATNGLQLNSQQLTNNANTQSGMNQAASQWANYDMARRNSGFGAAFKNSLGSALGSTIGSPSFKVGGASF